MSIFIAIISVLTLLVIAALVRPLLRPKSEQSVSSQRLNATIYKDQLAALERDLANGAISAADHEATRDELQLRLLDDTAAPDVPAAAPGFWTARRTAGLITLLLPLLSVGTYRWLGDPAALTPGAAQEAARLQITHMVESLEAQPLAEDPVLEKRMVAISEELRCLVCQNESLAGSRADLALDLKREIRSLIKAGKSDAEIMDFMVSRYGDFVRYRPPVNPVTWLLWFGPFLLLAGAVYGLVRMVRGGQRADAAPPTLDAAQLAKVRSLLQEPENFP